MRLLLLALLGACSLQGCATLVGAGIVADTNRQRRAEARTSGAGLAEHSPALGDTLTLVLASGGTRRGAVTAATPDSLTLDTGTFALADVERTERSWKRATFGPTLFVTALVDASILYLVLRQLSLDLGGIDIRL